MSECFIIMPISTSETYTPLYSNDKDHFIHVLNHLLRPAIEKAGLTAIPPIAEGADVIHAEIIKNLEQADLVLCDMSTLNPNVFFELGIRTALDKPVCIIKDDATPRIPFDTTIINYHTYLSSLAPWTLESQIDELVIHIQKSISRSNNRNPLWRYFGLSTRAALPEKKTNLDEKLELLSLQVEGISERLIREPIRQRILPTATDKADTLFANLREIASSRGVAINSASWDSKQMSIHILKGALDESTRMLMEELAQSEGYTLSIVDSKKG